MSTDGQDKTDVATGFWRLAAEFVFSNHRGLTIEKWRETHYLVAPDRATTSNTKSARRLMRRRAHTEDKAWHRTIWSWE